MKQILCAACVLASLAVAGCGDSGNSLSGSVSPELSLDFDTVVVSTITPFLNISYVKNSGPVAKPAELSVDLTGVTVVPGQAIDLAAAIGGGGMRGTLQRVEKTTITFPIKSGTLVLDEVPKPNANLSGHFNATLSMPDGRTLNGTFSSTLVMLR